MSLWLKTTLRFPCTPIFGYRVENSAYLFIHIVIAVIAFSKSVLIWLPDQAVILLLVRDLMTIREGKSTQRQQLLTLGKLEVGHQINGSRQQTTTELQLSRWDYNSTSFLLIGFWWHTFFTAFCYDEYLVLTWTIVWSINHNTLVAMIDFLLCMRVLESEIYRRSHSCNHGKSWLCLCELQCSVRC